MKILILILFFIQISCTYADSLPSTVTWNGTTGTKNCGTTISHGKTHYGIPDSNNSNPGILGGTINCTTHTFYSSSDYSINIAADSGIKTCNSGDLAVSISPFPCESGVCTLTCREFDDIPPIVTDLTSNLDTNNYHTANSSKEINITGDSASGSPIVLIKGKFESGTSENIFNSLIQSDSDNNSGNKNILETNEDISNIDGFINLNNYRDFIYSITEFCDEAGNCLGDGTISIKDFIYHIYAGNTDSDSVITGTGNFDNEIADATERNMILKLRDVYGNKIIPVYQSDGTTIVRDVVVDINYTNSLYLNQYSNTGSSGVEVNTYSNPIFGECTIGVGTTTMYENDKTVNSGDYSYSYKVYTPTGNKDSLSVGDFTIDNINITLSDFGLNSLNNSNINFYFDPIYTSQFISQIQSDGFLEGVSQSGSISITQTPFTPTPTANLYLEFGSGGISHIVSNNLDIKLTNPEFTIGEGNGNRVLFKNTILDLDSFDTTTLLTQTGVLDIIENQYISSHIGYTIDGHNVVYNGDIIGMNNYWGGVDLGSTSQQGLKVQGITHSQKQNDLTTSQSVDDIHLLGNIDKSSSKRDIRKNVFTLLKGVNSTNYNIGAPHIITSLDTATWNISNPGQRLLNNSILYFGELNGENIEIDSTDVLSGNKTLIVVGGNVYIKKNIINNSSLDILGIISLKDDNGNGGNIYIDPSITNLDAVIYSDKSIISYSSSYDNGLANLVQRYEIDGFASQELLKNQLYINGSIFSENTIGGSRNNLPMCPFYATYAYPSFTCSNEVSQKFDLNFLRRYYLLSPGNVLNGGLQSTGLSAIYEGYPVIIKYNSTMQSTPPPLFSK